MISVFSMAIEVALLVLSPVYRAYKEMRREDELDDDDDGKGIKGNSDGDDNEAKDDGDDVDKAPVAAAGEAADAAEKTDSVPNNSSVDKDENEQGDDDEKTANAEDGEPAAQAQVVKSPHNERWWLSVHWVVYGMFRALELVARPWVPSFDLIKIVVIVWLSLQGPEDVYDNYVLPVLNEYSPIIDYWLNQYDNTIDRLVATSEAMRSAAADVTNAINEAATGEPENVA